MVGKIVITLAVLFSAVLSAAATLDKRIYGGEAVKDAYPYLNKKRRYGHTANDIGILKLSTPIQKSKTIGYATLPDAGSDPVVGSPAIIAGWGLTEQRDDPLDQLKKATVPIHAREECSFERWNATGIEDELCAGGDGKDACAGDSGGPLIDKKTGHIIGITAVSSRFTTCAVYPGLYTRVSSYIDWIQENLGVSQTTSSVKS
ncbi:extracellular trypsin protease [Metarhizium brunneum]